MQKKILLLTIILGALLFSCEKEQDPFLITANSIGALTKDVKINELDSVFANDSLVKQVSSGELYRKSNEIEIYDKTGKKLLLLEPVQAFDSTSTVGFIQVIDPRFKTAKGLGKDSTFKDIIENYTISRIENTLSAAVIFIDDINVYVTIDKKQLPVELRYDTQSRIQAAQIPDNARIKYFMIDWD
ncbi:hypothetical protein [Salinimicrobium oceani]|uniref:Uncharacterized protein n=1 Tax=Salinimicrobium oceani TaxID=2722702 RepID=A0ABX1D100_9FLAO|nr:hypothetical protein [Salinimicrobium oceani]NJW54192.1 hypothetical protein [Salinimicrobium oceani]